MLTHLLHHRLVLTLLEYTLIVSTILHLRQLSRVVISDPHLFRLRHLLDLAAITTKPPQQAQQCRHQAHAFHHLAHKLNFQVKGMVGVVDILSAQSTIL